LEVRLTNILTPLDFLSSKQQYELCNANN